ncbi:MAG: phage tail tip lysozyme [Paracoccaceae bacterium]
MATALGSLFGPRDTSGFTSKETIKRQRLENALKKRAGTSAEPIQHGWQGIARIAQALDGAVGDYYTDKDEKQNTANAQAAFGGGPIAAALQKQPEPSPEPMNINPMATPASAQQQPMAGAGIGAGGIRSPGQANAMRGYDNPQAKEEYDYAISKGLQPHQAAAYAGAKLAESRFDPNARNPGDGRDGSDSVGVFQWNSGRANGLKQFASSQGKDWRDKGVQREYAFSEMDGSEKFAGNALRSAKTPEEATAAMLHYLRPAGYTRDNPMGAGSAGARIRNTQGILSAFGGNQSVPQPQQATQAAPQGEAQPAQQSTSPQQRGSMQWAMGLMNSPAFEYLQPGQQAVVQSIVNRGLSQEQADPTKQALAQEQLIAARRANSEVKSELVTRPDGSQHRVYADGRAPVQVFGAQTKEEGATAYMKELDAENRVRQQRGEKPLSISEYRTGLNKAGASSVNVTQKAEGEFDKKFVGNQGEMFGKFLEQKGNTESDTADIGQLRDLMGSGLPSGIVAAAQQGLGKVGIQTEGLGKIESFNAIINRLVPAQRQPGSGTMSDRDVELYKSSLPSLMQSPEGKQRILNSMEGMVQYKQAQSAIAERLSVGEINRQQALEALRSIPNPLAWIREQNKGAGKPAQPSATQAAPSGNKTKSGITWSVE